MSALTQIIQFGSEDNFVVTPTEALVEFTGTLARLASVRPADSTFFANFDSGVNALFGDGSLVGTLSGATVSGGRLSCLGNTVKYATWLGQGNASTGSQTGTIRFDYYPAYSGAPGSGNDHALACVQSSPLTAANEIQITHLGVGSIFVGFRNSAGVYVYNNTPPGASAWNPVAGTRYEFELNYNCTTGVAYLFINGVKFGDKIRFTPFTRVAADILQIILGSNYSLGYNANGTFDNFTLFDTMQHIANFTSEIPRAAISAYPTVDQTLVHSGIYMDGIESLAVETEVTGTDGIKHYLVADGVAKYWDGSAWSNSDGTYAQANTADEITDNAAALDISAGPFVKLASVLRSGTGASTPSITSATIEYDFFVPIPATPSVCIVWAEILDFIAAVPTGDISLVVELTKAYYSGENMILPFKKSFLANADGYVEAQLVESEVANVSYTFSVQYVNSAGKTTTLALGTGIVPNETEETNIQEIVTLPTA